MWHGMEGWGGLGVMHVIAWGVLVGIAVVVVLRLLGRDRGGRPADRATPLDILWERYARGEIDTAEFEDRLQHLKQAGFRRE